MKKRIISLLLALTLTFSLIPAAAWANDDVPDDNTGSQSNEELSLEEYLAGEGWESYPATKILTASTPMLFSRGVPSSTTAYLNISDMNGYTSSANSLPIGRHFIDDGNGLIVQAWCIEPSKASANDEEYDMEGTLSNQTAKDVLQIAYEWGYWDNTAAFTASRIAATQFALWWALGYSSVTCNDDSVNSLARQLYNAALADSGCGGGPMYGYECTTNTSHQRLATYYPYRNVTTEYGDIRIIKTSANPDITNGSDCYSLQGAVYGIYGSRNNAINDTNRLDTLITDANGNTGYSDDLEAGYTYFVKEITAPKGYALDETIYTVSVTANRTATLNVSDVPQSDPVGVVLKKVDAYTGLEYAQGNAKLEGAEYTVRFYNALYDTVAEAEASGNPTRTWVLRTNSNGFCYLDTPWLVSGDPFYYSADGYVTLPIGTVLMQETKAPEGYFINDEVYLVKITENGADETIIGAYNAPVTPEYVLQGNIQITKTTRTGRDQHVVMEDGAVFEIYLKSAGSYAAAAVTDKALVTTDSNGIAFAADLPYGTYTVHQVSGWPGSKLAPDFDVTIDTHGQTYTYDIENERFYSEVQLVKVDAVTGNTIPVAGIGFQIKYPDGTPFEYGGEDTWYTDANGTLTLPEALEYGIGYMAIELNAPDGYVMPTAPFLFDVTEDNATYAGGTPLVVVEVENEPTKIEVYKEDVNGNPIPGAKLQVLDDTGALVEEWVSGTTSHIVYALHIGKDYTFREVEAPEGYVRTTITATLTIPDSPLPQSVGIINKQVFVEKVDTDNHALSGAKLQVIDSQGNVVDEWISGSSAHAVSGLVALNGQYTLREVEAPEGCARAKDIAFVVEHNNENQTITMVNKQVVVEKTDASSAALSGAKLQVFDSTGTKIDEWTSGSDAHAVKGLIVGQTYTIHEESAPAGYALAKDSTFTVVDDGEKQSVTVVNKKVAIEKVDPYGNPFSGATLQVLDKDGNKLDEWTTDGTTRTINGLVVGQTYTIHETAAPSGWLLAPDMTFTVADDSKDQTVAFENEEQPVIGTTATVDGRHDALAKKDVTLKDVVSYEKLIPGREYVVKGTLMDKATGKALLDKDGKVITSSVAFKPTASSGTVEVTFTYTPVPGSSTVVFEDLYRNNRLICTHADINDANQTVSYPSIKTTAKIDGEKEAYRSGDTMTITDVIEYKGLTVGKEYTVQGVLINKKDGEALKLRGTDTQITATAKFTPTESSGSVTVEFELPTNVITATTDVVVYEELYDADYRIAEHKDLNDAGQTVKIRIYVPYIPPAKVESPNSGDNGISALLIAGAASILGLGVLFTFRRRMVKSKD